MNVFSFKDAKDVAILADYLMPLLKEKKFLLLNGELGAGKTTLVQAIAKKIGIKEKVTSPSFNYMKIYDGLVHIDAYNIKGDLEEFEDYFDNNIVAIEWSDKLNYNFDKFIRVDVSVDENFNHLYHVKEY